MENDNHLPEMTEEKRKAALERSLAARRERMEFKDLVRKGELSLADALDDCIVLCRAGCLGIRRIGGGAVHCRWISCSGFHSI